MSGPRPSRKRPSAVHRRAGHARPPRHRYNKKRLFSKQKKRGPLCLGAALDVLM